jgi:signal peptidase I
LFKCFLVTLIRITFWQNKNPIICATRQIKKIMAKPFRLQDVFANILLVIGLAAIWMAFAPVKLGGQVTYVIVNGVSMLPTFHGGDLVIVRQAVDYRVGDVVTYYYPDLRENVIHRIIAVENERYVIKGDNNSWIDAYQPTRAEILGKLWLHLPKVAFAVLWIRTPINMALVTSAAGGLFMVSMTTEKSRRRSKRNPVSNPAGLFGTSLTIFGSLVLLFGVFGLFVFTRPLTRKADVLKYNQTANFTYSAAGLPVVYDTGTARSGEPIFLKLACTVNLGFAYKIEADQLKDINGRQKFYALLKDDETGWQRTIPITADMVFSGSSFSNVASLDLCKLESLVSSVGDATGVHSGSNTLVITANISVGGKISGLDFSTEFNPHLSFHFDSKQFYLIRNASQPDPMQTVEAGSLDNPGQIQNTIDLFGSKPPVLEMRKISEYGLGISLGALLVVGSIYMIVISRSEEKAIRIKYGGLLMDIYDLGLDDLAPMIEVTSIEELARLAERQNVMIMHFKREFLHIYLVQAGGINYRFGFEEVNKDIPA